MGAERVTPTWNKRDYNSMTRNKKSPGQKNELVYFQDKRRIGVATHFFYFLMVFLISVTFSLTVDAQTLRQVCDQLIKDLNRNTPLSRLSLELKPNSFVAQDSTFIYPFSKELQNTIAASLTGSGVIPNQTRTNSDTKSQIVGTYLLDRENNRVAITVHLIQAGENRATAVGQMRFYREHLKWFKHTYENTANAMIECLLDSFRLEQERIIEIAAIELEPRHGDQAVIKFGGSFPPYLKAAIDKLPQNFGVIRFSATGQARIIGKYILQGRGGQNQPSVNLDLQLIDTTKRSRATSSVFSIGLEPGDEKPVSTGTARVMILPDPGETAAGNREILSVIDGMAEALARKRVRVFDPPSFSPTEQELDSANVKLLIKVHVLENTRGREKPRYVVAIGSATIMDRINQNRLGTFDEEGRARLRNRPNARTDALNLASEGAGKKLGKQVYRLLESNYPDLLNRLLQ